MFERYNTEFANDLEIATQSTVKHFDCLIACFWYYKPIMQRLLLLIIRKKVTQIGRYIKSKWQNTCYESCISNLIKLLFRDFNQITISLQFIFNVCWNFFCRKCDIIDIQRFQRHQYVTEILSIILILDRILLRIFCELGLCRNTCSG